MIQDGRVKINSTQACLGDKADPSIDNIYLDDKVVKKNNPQIYIILYKPRGFLSTINKDDQRQNIFDLVEIEKRIYPVGRLDYDSEGLILLTNDGELTDHLTHPKYEHEKEYRVKVRKRPQIDQINKWRKGVCLDDGYKTKPASVEIESYTENGAWLVVTLREGKKRQIRRTGQALDLPVERIIRTRIANLELGKLKPKQWRYLNEIEISRLKNFLHI